MAKGDAPLAILYDKGDNPTNPLIATIVEGKRKEAVDFLKELHDEVLGQGEFDYSFVEDEVKKLYDEDKRATQIYVTFAGLAICISCLGLFGLSLYDIRQRYREIALRKVMALQANKWPYCWYGSIYIYWGGICSCYSFGLLYHS